MDIKNIHNHYEEELHKLQEDPNHYITPGAKTFFRRVMLGYIVLAIAGAFGVWQVTERVDNQIRKDLNQAAHRSCLNTRPILEKYNDLVDIQIETNRNERELSLLEGDFARADLHTDTIIRLQHNKINVPTENECRGRELVRR